MADIQIRVKSADLLTHFVLVNCYNTHFITGITFLSSYGYATHSSIPSMKINQQPQQHTDRPSETVLLERNISQLWQSYYHTLLPADSEARYQYSKWIQESVFMVLSAEELHLILMKHGSHWAFGSQNKLQDVSTSGVFTLLLPRDFKFVWRFKKKYWRCEYLKRASL